MTGCTSLLSELRGRTGLSVFFIVSLVILAGATNTLAKRNISCRWCHTEEQHNDGFLESAHAVINCATCHQGIEDVYLHQLMEEETTTLSCTVCHKDVSAKYEHDLHKTADIGCTDCHTDIHTFKKSDQASFKANVVNNCTGCHDDNNDVISGHGAKVLAGNNDAASCVDCHDLHRVQPVSELDQEAAAAFRLRQTETCSKCHSNVEIAERNNLNPMVVEGFTETYHGKAIGLGFGDGFAGCADCHSNHVTLPASMKESPVHPDNRQETCGKCHNGFDANFTDFIAHPDHTDGERFPVLHGVYLFMEGLLLSVFAVFWIHTFLWWRKAYWLHWTSRKAGEVKTVENKENDGAQYVERFKLRYRIMHILLVSSFLLLVLTGMPIKYHDAQWAGAVMNLLGGPENAALIHRISAAIEIIMFLYVLLASLKYIFVGSNGTKGWLGRLFGPDSLCPNMKDAKDIKDMVLWFFNKGDGPKFDRWTYFEKFDFFAVFWGMTIIGGSGLIMWFPEQVSHILPGWMINVATIAHSEEALLAAIFIFTVHFFNTHLVPNKFPLEDNVFTGRYTMEEFKHERPEEYERMIEEGRLESLKAEKPSIGIKLFSAFFGYGAVIIGLTLTVLIAWAYFG